MDRSLAPSCGRPAGQKVFKQQQLPGAAQSDDVETPLAADEPAVHAHPPAQAVKGAVAAQPQQGLEPPNPDQKEEEDNEVDRDGHAGPALEPSETSTLLPGGLHHLTRHWLPEDARGGVAVLQRLGADSVRSAEQLIKNMGQRQLREAFERVYGSTTQSFNNQWLRRKLCEALGVRSTPACRSRGSSGRRLSGEKRPPAKLAGPGRRGGRGGRSTFGGRAIRASQHQQNQQQPQQQQQQQQQQPQQQQQQHQVPPVNTVHHAAEANAEMHLSADALLLASSTLATPKVKSLAGFDRSPMQPLATSDVQQRTPTKQEQVPELHLHQQHSQQPQPQQPLNEAPVAPSSRLANKGPQTAGDLPVASTGSMPQPVVMPLLPPLPAANAAVSAADWQPEAESQHYAHHSLLGQVPPLFLNAGQQLQRQRQRQQEEDQQQEQQQEEEEQQQQPLQPPRKQQQHQER